MFRPITPTPSTRSSHNVTTANSGGHNVTHVDIKSTQDFLDALPKTLLTSHKRKALLQHFGDSLADALSQRHPSVAQSVGDVKATEIFSLWDEHKNLQTAMEWLKNQGLSSFLSESQVHALVACHGQNTQSLLRDTPYELLGLLEWPQADALALKQGFSSHTPQRLQAALEAALHHRLETEGHTWSSVDSLLPLAQGFLDRGSAGHHAVAQSHNQRPQSGLAGVPSGEEARGQEGSRRETSPAPVCLSLEAAEEALKVLSASGRVVSYSGGWQTGGCWKMEQDILDAVRVMAKEPLITTVQNVLIPKLTKTPTRKTVDTNENLSVPLSAAQQQAVDLALSWRFAMIAGHAGSGKTTALRSLVQTLTRNGRHVHILALSARAAKRASDAAQHPAQTIAGFLLHLSVGKITLNPNDTLIVDEASMLDLVSLWKIIKRLNGASLVLVGDPAQLPPIGFGLTLHALLTHKDLPSVTLTEIFRQDAKTGIPHVANTIRRGEAPNLLRWESGCAGVSWLPCQIDDLMSALHQVGSDLRAQGNTPDDIQILCPIKHGPTGTHAINAHFQRQQQERRDGQPLNERPDLSVGDKVVWTRNDWDRGLLNGSLGRIVGQKCREVLVAFDGTTHSLTWRDLAHLEPAYALSIHRAQGSQWHSVVLPIFRNRLLSRYLLYTAVTRATHNVIAVGKHISHIGRISHKRQVGMSKQ